ncbi:hypothetical protein HHUSO_G7455 [Huso huso]|uniref:CCHC-type domain-containing protein n=1 Tax=Huso huso TaxID=61971 RepID=A0ABR0ZW14_HUSHU
MDSGGCRESKGCEKRNGGGLLIECMSKKMLGLEELGQIPIESYMRQEKKICKGVIYGVMMDITVEELEEELEKDQVVEVRRIGKRDEKGEVQSTTVVLTFELENMPEQVIMGFQRFRVNEYRPSPIRCYKCQLFGHMAGSCRGKRRCAKCGKDHEFRDCDVKGQGKCCNCGGEHSTAFKGCVEQIKAREIQIIKFEEKTSYVSAVKRYKEQMENKIQREKIQMNSRQEKAIKSIINVNEKVTKETLLVNKKQFLLFIIEVINCTAQTKNRTEKMQIVSKAGERYLGIEVMSVEQINELLERGGSRK